MIRFVVSVTRSMEMQLREVASVLVDDRGRSKRLVCLMPTVVVEANYHDNSWQECTQFYFDDREAAENFAEHLAASNFGAEILISTVDQIYSSIVPKVTKKDVTDRGILPTLGV